MRSEEGGEERRRASERRRRRRRRRETCGQTHSSALRTNPVRRRARACSTANMLSCMRPRAGLDVSLVLLHLVLRMPGPAVPRTTHAFVARERDARWQCRVPVPLGVWRVSVRTGSIRLRGGPRVGGQRSHVERQAAVQANEWKEMDESGWSEPWTLPLTVKETWRV